VIITFVFHCLYLLTESMPDPENKTQTPELKADAALLSLALMWGTSHVITKGVLATHSPFFYTSMRFGLAAACFALVFARRLRRSARREVVEGVLLGLCSFAGISLYVAGLVFTQASKAGFITGLYLVFTPLLSLALFGVRPTKDHVAGLLLAVSGFSLLSFPSSGEAINWGDLLVLAAAAAWALHIVATSAFASRSDVRTLAALQVMTVAALAGAVYLMLSWMASGELSSQTLPRLVAIEARANPLTWRFVAQVGYMAVVVTFVAALVQTWAQGRTSATYAVILYALEPVSAAVFAYLAFGERLGWRGAAGAATIVAGVFVSRLKLLTAGRKQKADGGRQWAVCDED
jgi:drug/metabolite transporter (DMT)-like permease